MKYFLASLCLLIAGLCMQFAFAANCDFGGGEDIKSAFKDCNPSIGIDAKPNADYDVQDSGSDFRTFVGTFTRRIQIFTSIIAIGMIVWIGLGLVLPVSAEVKEAYKGKLISVILGFLAMIAATLIVNGLINLVYEVFK